MTKRKALAFAVLLTMFLGSTQPVSAADGVNTIITQYNETGNFLRSDPVDIQIKHPTAVECEEYKAPTSKFDEDYGGRNCSFSIEYLLSSTGSKIDFFASGLVTNKAGEKIGEFASIIMVSDKYALNVWNKATVNARMQSSGQLFLALAPFSTRT
ncbi:MAG: hypothetical protein RI987_571, partial [Actinomycetota bacterium]